MQANLGKYFYKSDRDAYRQIKQTEGIWGLYRAYGATVASFGPFSALYFLFYEKLKGQFVDNSADAYLKKQKEGQKTADIGFA